MKLSLKKYIDELESIDLDLNWYFEDGGYQNIIDSQFSSILERADWYLRKNSHHALAEKIQQSLPNIQNIAGQINFVIEFLSEEENAESSKKEPITNLKRIELINKIASHLQDRMVTTEINTFLSGFGIAIENVSIVPSKRVYVQELLKTSDANTIQQIGKELGYYIESNGVLSAKNVTELIKQNNLNSVLDDFNRALNTLEVDSEQAIASSSSTLESICKAIIELEGEQLPKKQTLSVLLSKAVEIVGFNPNQHSDGEIKRILGGIQNVILGVGALRTGYSTAHGHGIKKYKLSQRHVRLLVNSMITFGMFTLETYIEKKGKN